MARIMSAERSANRLMAILPMVNEERE